MNDIYCARCDVFGHEYGSRTCDEYYTAHEVPFREKRRSQIGKIKALATDATEMWPVGSDSKEPTFFATGHLVRITDWTPWQNGMSAGDYWTIQTLDGQFSATQIYNDELKDPEVLDELALIKYEESEDQ